MNSPKKSKSMFMRTEFRLSGLPGELSKQPVSKEKINGQNQRKLNFLLYHRTMSHKRNLKSILMRTAFA